MRIVDRYIEKNILSVYLFVLCVFIGLYYIIDIFSHLSDFLETKPPLPVYLQYYLFMIPLIFLRVSPFALLISTLYTFGELNKNNEIVTLRASGLSLGRLAFPAIFFAFFLSFLTLFLQERILIHSQKKVEDITIQYIKKQNFSSSEVKNFPFLSQDEIYLVGSFSGKEEKLKNVIVFKENAKGMIINQMMCKEIRYENETWTAHEIIEYSFDEKGNRNEPLRWDKKSVGLKEKPQELLYKRSVFLEFTPLKEMHKRITRLKRIKTQSKLNPITVEFHQKLSQPFTHLFLILGVLPFALEVKKRKVGFISLGIGFIFYFAYHFLCYFSVALGKEGFLLPFIAAWIGPLFFLTVGITGMKMIK